MSGHTTGSAILLLVIGNFLAMLSDVVIKMGGSDIPVFQFAFFRAVITLVMVALFFGHQIAWSKLFEGFGVHSIRAHIHLAGMACMVVALNELPLATANAIFYTAPLMIVAIAVLFQGERASALSSLALVSGFAGVLVILRPVEFGGASLMAIGVAVSLAICAVLVRKLPAGQTTAHKLFINYLLLLPAAAVCVVIEDAPFSPSTLIISFSSAIFIIGYSVAILLAYRHVEANRVTSAEYTGLIWAILIGWFWFGEEPDLYFLAGTGLIVIPLFAMGLWEGRSGPKRMNALQPATAVN